MSPLTLKLHHQTLTLASFGSLRPFSSSSSPSPPPFPPVSDHQSNNNDNNNQQQQTPSPSSYSSLFGDIKNRLKSAQPPPRRIPDNPSPPPPPPAASIADIRKTLAEFRLRSPPNPPDPNNPTPSSVPSFQQLFKINNDTNAPATPNRSNNSADRLSFQSIRASLQQFRDRPNNQPPGFRNRVSHTPAAAAVASAPLVGDQESVFGKEGEAETKKLRTEFLKSYSFDELGEKLRRLRPDGAEKAGGFSPEELNGRLAKLRELEEKEEKENELRMGGVGFRDLRESLLKLKEADDNKKANNTQKLSMLVNIGKPSLPLYMMAPPQEKLLENYFHPDHMSSAEKMKLELKKVRDEFKMSESDCGSARVQVAQLTTKIKHLSSVLHKKDKHSRKGLHEMVQTRKKLLKYLRRTDWESYCFVLSKLGLRDVPEYKTPDYKA